jgi:hypothetical protein
MATLENEKPLAGDMEQDIVDRFDAQVKKLKLTKKKVLRSLALWWLALNEDEQQALYHQEAGYNMTAMVNKVVQVYLESPEGARNLAEIISEIGRAQLRTHGRKN